jgi:hypothetical protein
VTGECGAQRQSERVTPRRRRPAPCGVGAPAATPFARAACAMHATAEMLACRRQRQQAEQEEEPHRARTIA